MKLNTNYLLLIVTLTLLMTCPHPYSDTRKAEGKAEAFVNKPYVLLTSSGEPVYGSTERKVACSHLIQSTSLVWVNALECNTSLQKLSMILSKQHAESGLEMIENSSFSYGIGNEYPSHSDLKSNVIQPFLPSPLLQ